MFVKLLVSDQTGRGGTMKKAADVKKKKLIKSGGGQYRLVKSDSGYKLRESKGEYRIN